MKEFQVFMEKFVKRRETVMQMLVFWIKIKTINLLLPLTVTEKNPNFTFSALYHLLYHLLPTLAPLLVQQGRRVTWSITQRLKLTF